LEPLGAPVDVLRRPPSSKREVERRAHKQVGTHPFIADEPGKWLPMKELPPPHTTAKLAAWLGHVGGKPAGANSYACPGSPFLTARMRPIIPTMTAPAPPALMHRSAAASTVPP
jgi:hypothetical protein